MFTRAYRGATFVAWNLRYDSGSLLQQLTKENLQILRESSECEQSGFRYKVIGNKCLTIRRGKNAVTIYDIYTFYLMSLDRAAKKYLGRGKLDQDVKLYTKQYILKEFNNIAEYCIQDATLTRDLALLLIESFESFGVFPKKLYSTAYVSWSYFRRYCPYIHVKRYWDSEPYILQAATAAYNGGKFEVTTKGPGHYYEYDIVSAYPAEIARLVDIRKARVWIDPKYHASAAFGWLHISARLPMTLPSPIAVKRGDLCTFPAGLVERWVTKAEYEYLIESNVDVRINRAFWLMVEKREYPYRDRIAELVEAKHRFKLAGDELRYYTVKIFLNSLYGKFCQLTPKDDRLEAGAAWNPIYAADITARTRVAITRMQRDYKSVVAVHTDSVTSTEPLPIQTGSALGDFEASVSGEGIILGSGIYQIGTKTKFRGFVSKTPLLELIPASGDVFELSRERPIGWREVAWRGLDVDRINRFEPQLKRVNIHFDRKRLWLRDWVDWADARARVVRSLPLISLGGASGGFAIPEPEEL